MENNVLKKIEELNEMVDTNNGDSILIISDIGNNHTVNMNGKGIDILTRIVVAMNRDEDLRNLVKTAAAHYDEAVEYANYKMKGGLN